MALPASAVSLPAVANSVNTAGYVIRHLSAIYENDKSNFPAYIKLCHSVLYQAAYRTHYKASFVTVVDIEIIAPNTDGKIIIKPSRDSDAEADLLQEILNFAECLLIGTIVPGKDQILAEPAKLLGLIERCLVLIEKEALALKVWEPKLPPSTSLAGLSPTELEARSAEFLEQVEGVEHNLRKIVNLSGLTFSIIDSIRNFSVDSKTAVIVRAVNPYFRDVLTTLNLGFKHYVDTPSGRKEIKRAHGKPLDEKRKGARDPMAAGHVLASETDAHCSKQINPTNIHNLIMNTRANVPIHDLNFGDKNTIIITSPDCRNCWRLIPIDTVDGSQLYEIYNIWGVEEAREIDKFNLAGSLVRLRCGFDRDGEPYLIIPDIDIAAIIALTMFFTKHISRNPEYFREVINVVDINNYLNELRNNSASQFKGIGTRFDIESAVRLNNCINTALAAVSKGTVVTDLIRHPSDVSRPGEYTSIDNMVVFTPDGRVGYCSVGAVYGRVLESLFNSGKYLVPVHCKYPFDFIEPYRDGSTVSPRLIVTGQDETMAIMYREKSESLVAEPVTEKAKTPTNEARRLPGIRPAIPLLANMPNDALHSLDETDVAVSGRRYSVAVALSPNTFAHMFAHNGVDLTPPKPEQHPFSIAEACDVKESTSDEKNNTVLNRSDRVSVGHLATDDEVVHVRDADQGTDASLPPVIISANTTVSSITTKYTPHPRAGENALSLAGDAVSSVSLSATQPGTVKGAQKQPFTCTQRLLTYLFGCQTTQIPVNNTDETATPDGR